ncbi:MAG: bifunctional methylenetetrahydrofolate dehydrogenase/methenyltetrahydrofolate cyclohydrolase FolD [Myxococcales bacterium]|nr:bifunctional methylenetetrahydrofolate dehydrogenase/methenyltetrahydrofolate cyclohydrolase FolD [Myxococcales bacterium]
MSTLLDGKALAKQVRSQLKQEVDALVEKGCTPGLDVILVGEDPASQIYVRNKHLACEKVGIRSRIHKLPADTPQQQLEDLLQSLNQDPQVHGILLQLPLPKGLDADAALLKIDPTKDVDGLHPDNLGLLAAGRPGLRPCTPQGCIALLDSISYDLKGKHAVVLGRSILVGKPVALLLLERHATVTICHSRTQDLPAVVRQADVLIAAVGQPHLVKADWLKPGAVVVDVGTNRLDDGRLVGDVDFEAAQSVVSAISPVPGGVGPMTITMLLVNTAAAAKKINGLA